MTTQNAAGAFANRSSWHEADPNKTVPFAHLVGSARQSHVEKALRALGRQGVASICGLVDYDGALKEAYKNSWEGRYLVSMMEGGDREQIICHAKPFINLESYRLSNEVYKHIRKDGLILAPELLPYANGDLMQHIDGIDAAFTDFIPGRPVDPNKGDMWDAASGIATFKHSMTSLPANLVSAIAENGKSITARVQNGVDFMLSAAGQDVMNARFDAAETRILTSIAEIYQEETEKGVVPCHGDLVPGNYYVGDKYGTPLFLDFDNIGASMFPADVDIGTVLHRIGFEKSDDQSPSTLKEIFIEVREGYNDAYLDKVEMTSARLARSMKTAVGWKLCGSFGELAGGESSYMGAEGKIRRFGDKALEVQRLALTFEGI